MLNKLRELERLLEPNQNDYLVALRERIHPIKGRASLGESVHHTCDESGNEHRNGDGWGDGDSSSLGDGRGCGHNENSFFHAGDGESYNRNGDGSGNDIFDESIFIQIFTTPQTISADLFQVYVYSMDDGPIE